MLELRERYRDRITIRLGIEADYFAGSTSKTATVLASADKARVARWAR